MSLTFACTFEEFKTRVAEFCKACPTCDEDQLENGFKALSLSYLAMEIEAEYQRVIAVSYFKYATRQYEDRKHQLLKEVIHGP